MCSLPNTMPSIGSLHMFITSIQEDTICSLPLHSYLAWNLAHLALHRTDAKPLRNHGGNSSDKSEECTKSACCHDDVPL